MKFKLTLILLIGALLFGAQTLKAQTTITPSHIKAAERMLIASNMQSNLQKNFSAMIETQSQLLPAEKRDAFKSVMNKFLSKYVTFEEIKKAFVQIYAETYSEDELSKIADFLSTPAGIKMTSMQSELVKKGGEWGLKLFKDHEAELEQMMTDEMSKK